MQRLNSKKATAIDTIFQKLIKEAVDFFTPILTKSISSNIFFDFAKKKTLVVPLNKGKSSKN